jgi:hypothetical protein
MRSANERSEARRDIGPATTNASCTPMLAGEVRLKIPRLRQQTFETTAASVMSSGRTNGARERRLKTRLVASPPGRLSPDPRTLSQADQDGRVVPDRTHAVQQIAGRPSDVAACLIS